MPASTTTYLILGSCLDTSSALQRGLAAQYAHFRGQTEGQRGEQDRDGSQLPISNQRHQTSPVSYAMRGEVGHWWGMNDAPTNSEHGRLGCGGYFTYKNKANQTATSAW